MSLLVISSKFQQRASYILKYDIFMVFVLVGTMRYSTLRNAMKENGLEPTFLSRRFNIDRAGI